MDETCQKIGMNDYGEEFHDFFPQGVCPMKGLGRNNDKLTFLNIMIAAVQLNPRPSLRNHQQLQFLMPVGE